MLLSSLTLLATALGLTTAVPVVHEPRFEAVSLVVETVSCSPLAVNSSVLSVETILNSVWTNVTQMGIDESGLMDIMGGGTFGFEVCTSSFKNTTSTDTVSYGHLLSFDNATNATSCLTVRYPYDTATISIEPCSYSDDSGQILQWWKYTKTTGPDGNIVVFVGPDEGRPDASDTTFGPDIFNSTHEGGIVKVQPQGTIDVDDSGNSYYYLWHFGTDFKYEI